MHGERRPDPDRIGEMVPALQSPRIWKLCVLGCLFGALALTRASYVVLLPFVSPTALSTLAWLWMFDSL